MMVSMSCPNWRIMGCSHVAYGMRMCISFVEKILTYRVVNNDIVNATSILAIETRECQETNDFLRIVVNHESVMSLKYYYKF